MAMTRRSLILRCGLLAAALPFPAWAQDEPTAQDDLATQAEARPYAAFADRVVQMLVAGDGKGFRELLSPTGMAAATPEQVDGFVNGQVLPFFADYGAPGPSTTITRTKHPAGFTGFAFYTSFTSTGGQAKPFVLYVVEEAGKLVVGNLLVGKTFQDLHPPQ
jgi:hypothetical protein